MLYDAGAMTFFKKMDIGSLDLIDYLGIYLLCIMIFSCYRLIAFVTSLLEI